MMGELARALKESGREMSQSPIRPAQLAELLGLIANGTISGAIAKGVFETMFASGRAAGDIVRTGGLTQLDDEAEIVQSIAGVLGHHADAVAQYRAGKAAAFGFLVGQVMKATAGRANPKRVNELLKRTLERGEAGKAG
jgi:aspartyl-tRNA(Asn)/glutamyl-tRNA(Gln) amidotransferase subunit B